MPTSDDLQEISVEQVELAMHGDIDELQNIFAALIVYRIPFSPEASQSITEHYQRAGNSGIFLFFLVKSRHLSANEQDEHTKRFNTLVAEQFPLAVLLRAHQLQKQDIAASYELLETLKDSKFSICRLAWFDAFAEPEITLRKVLEVHQHYKTSYPLIADRCLSGAFVYIKKHLTPATFKIFYDFCSQHPRLMSQFKLFTIEHVSPRADSAEFLKAIGRKIDTPLFSQAHYQQVLQDTFTLVSATANRLKRYKADAYEAMSLTTVTQELMASRNVVSSIDEIAEFIDIHRKDLEIYIGKDKKFKNRCVQFMSLLEKTKQDLAFHQDACQKVVDGARAFVSNASGISPEAQRMINHLSDEIHDLTDSKNIFKKAADRLNAQSMQLSDVLLHTYNIFLTACLHACPTVDKSRLSFGLFQKSKKKFEELHTQLADCLFSEEEIKTIITTGNIGLIRNKITHYVDVAIQTQQALSEQQAFPDNGVLEKLLLQLPNMRTELEIAYNLLPTQATSYR